MHYCVIGEMSHVLYECYDQIVSLVLLHDVVLSCGGIVIIKIFILAHHDIQWQMVKQIIIQ